MNKLETAQDRAMELIGEIGQGIRKAMPGKALNWVETGAALGAMRTGGRVATRFVRRNPVLAGAAIAGAVAGGLVAYQARRNPGKQPDWYTRVVRERTVLPMLYSPRPAWLVKASDGR